MKALKYIAIGMGAIFGGRYLLSLSRASKKVLVSVSGKRGLITAQGINVQLEYNIKNPSRANLRITAPLIKLLVNNKLIASSTMQNVEIPASVKDERGRISIHPFSETGIISTNILVPWLSILSVSPAILARLQNQNSNEKVEVTIETTSQVFTAIGDFPLDDVVKIQL